MSELVEKVADAILTADESEAQASPTRLSRAAIAAVFDWLAVASAEAISDGRYAIGGEPDSHADTEDAARDCWEAMLAEMRKAALGE